jgi:hypothetical protein
VKIQEYMLSIHSVVYTFNDSTLCVSICFRVYSTLCEYIFCKVYVSVSIYIVSIHYVIVT